MLEFETLFRFVGALALVAGLIWLMALAARRLRGVAMTGGRGGRRLQVVEALGVDAKRRLVIVRADDREMTLLIGGETDLLLHSDVAKSDVAKPAESPTDAA